MQSNNLFLKKCLSFCIVALLLLFLTSCAETLSVEACISGKTYGFWNGLWHGIITPFTFIISLFKDDVAIYAINNSGHVYNLGYVLGLAIIFGGSGKASHSRG